MLKHPDLTKGRSTDTPSSCAIPRQVGALRVHVLCTLNQGMEYLDPAIRRPGRLRSYRYPSSSPGYAHHGGN